VKYDIPRAAYFYSRSSESIEALKLSELQCLEVERKLNLVVAKAFFGKGSWLKNGLLVADCGHFEILYLSRFLP
jgi:hypothetical protein